jgi:uncharacterized protein (TIGR00369 family)
MTLSILDQIRATNATAPFNRWAGFDVTAAAEGRAEIRLVMRDDLTQYSGFLHAGVTGALIDTVCGYAAATVVGPVLASHYQVAFYAPVVGENIIARGRVMKAGKRQIFANAELFAVADGQERLVAGGSSVLMVAMG